MVELTEELLDCMRQFKEKFDDIIPLMELPATASTEEVVNIAKESIEAGVNLFPRHFNYEQLENDKRTII